MSEPRVEATITLPDGSILSLRQDKNAMGRAKKWFEAMLELWEDGTLGWHPDQNRCTDGDGI